MRELGVLGDAQLGSVSPRPLCGPGEPRHSPSAGTGSSGAARLLARCHPALPASPGSPGDARPESSGSLGTPRRELGALRGAVPAASILPVSTPSPVHPCEQRGRLALTLCSFAPLEVQVSTASSYWVPLRSQRGRDQFCLPSPRLASRCAVLQGWSCGHPRALPALPLWCEHPGELPARPTVAVLCTVVQLQVGSGRAPRGASSHSRPGSFCIKAFLFPLSVFSCHFLSLSPGRAAGEGYERSATEEAGSSSSFSISEGASMLPGPVWGCSWAPALAAPQPSLGPGGGRCPWNPLAGSPCHAAGLWHHLAPGYILMRRVGPALPCTSYLPRAGRLPLLFCLRHFVALAVPRGWAAVCVTACPAVTWHPGLTSPSSAWGRTRCRAMCCPFPSRC